MAEAERARRKWSESSSAWIGHVRQIDRNREYLLDEPMLALAGNVEGKRVLDVGCGEGRFCRMLAERSASVVGVDPTVPFLAAAKAEGPDSNYARAIGETLPIASDSFDLAVMYLSLIDIPDFAGAITEVARVLRLGGRLLIANLNSFATTRPAAWYRDSEGRKLHVAVEDYYEERAVDLEWGGLSIVNWHRPFEAYMGALLSAGLILEHFAEPRPSPEAVERFPTMLDEYRVPLFHVMRWRK